MNQAKIFILMNFFVSSLTESLKNLRNQIYMIERNEFDNQTKVSTTQSRMKVKQMWAQITLMKKRILKHIEEFQWNKIEIEVKTILSSLWTWISQFLMIKMVLLSSYREWNRSLKTNLLTQSALKNEINLENQKSDNLKFIISNCKRKIKVDAWLKENRS